PDLCAKGPNAGVVSSNGLRGINQREEMPFVGAGPLPGTTHCVTITDTQMVNCP
ncbi:MAG: hypothetical protein ACI9OU_000677, partial [Candidatus Promineifilaceae bacterium]